MFPHLLLLPICFPSLLSFSLMFSPFLILLAFPSITRKRYFCSFSQWNVICHSQRILKRKSLELLRDSHSSLAWPPSLLHWVASFLELQADTRCSCMHSSSRDFAWPEPAVSPCYFMLHLTKAHRHLRTKDQPPRNLTWYIPHLGHVKYETYRWQTDAFMVMTYDLKSISGCLWYMWVLKYPQRKV